MGFSTGLVSIGSISLASSFFQGTVSVLTKEESLSTFPDNVEVLSGTFLVPFQVFRFQEKISFFTDGLSDLPFFGFYKQCTRGSVAEVFLPV